MRLPILKTKDELIEELKAGIPANCGLDDAQILAALERALTRWSDISQVAVGYEEEISPDNCEVLLPCEGMDNITVKVKREGTGCNGDYCWERLLWWDVVGDNLILPGRPTGTIYIEAYASQPDVKEDLALSKQFVGGNDEMWIAGRVNLPSAGWVQICGEWFSYVCTRQVEGAATLYDAEPLIPSESQIIPSDQVWDEVILPASDLLDPGEPLGLHTVLENVKQHPHSETDVSYQVGEQILPGFAVYYQSAFSALIDVAIANAYHTLITCCTREEDRQFYREMMDDHYQRAEGGMVRGAPRQPQIKYIPSRYTPRWRQPRAKVSYPYWR